MKTRILLSLVMVPIFAFFIFFNNPYPMIGLIFIALNWALIEAYAMLEKKALKPYAWAGLTAGSLIYFMAFFGRFEAIVVAWAVLMMMLFILAVVSREPENFTRIGATYLPLIYISTMGLFSIRMRLMDNGYYLIFLLFLLTLIYDAGAYFAGSFFGKNKLIPEISKGKTVEGCIGGVIINVITVTIIGFTWLPRGLFGPHTAIHLMILAVLLSVFGQFGDLGASLMKRFCGVKNSSDLLPEMGGVLDKIDSALFNAPVLYLYVKYIVPLF
jgi:phosphatidate cytidylyltransferase